MVYSAIGRTDEARVEIAACGNLDPAYSLERVRDMIPYRDRALVERWMATLRELQRV
jgi:hypothetical protein